MISPQGLFLSNTFNTMAAKFHLVLVTSKSIDLLMNACRNAFIRGKISCKMKIISVLQMNNQKKD